MVLLSLVLIVGSAYLFYRFEFKALAPLVIGAVVVSLLWGSYQDIPAILAPFIFGAIGGYTFKKVKSFGFYVVAASLMLALAMTGNYYYLRHVKGLEVIKVSKTEMSEILNASSMPEDMKGQIMDNFEMFIETARDLVPFSSFVYALIFSIFVYFALKMFFSRFIDVRAVKGIEYLRLNDYTIFFLIGGWALFLLIDKSGYYTVKIIGLNIALIVSTLYFMQALGVLKFYTVRRGLPGYLIPLGFITILFVFKLWALFFIVFLTGFGVLDFWADFRKLNVSTQTEEE